MILGSLISTIFIEEDLKRLSKDTGISKDKVNSINKGDFKDNEECLLTDAENNNKNKSSRRMSASSDL